MSRGYPSLTALLGLLAIAGYQNRDKIAELLRGTDKKPGAATQGGIGGSSTICAAVLAVPRPAAS
jgi:uncharacterized protein YidB (DUF937 family)